MSKLSEKIKSCVKNVKPKPKWQFTSYNLAKEIVLVICWILAVVGVGMVIYIIAHNNPWEFLVSKPDGFYHAIIGLPWEMMTILMILIIAIFFISRKIHFIYRNNSWIILILICTSVAVGYFIIEKVGLNKRLSEFQMAEEIYMRGGKFIAPDRGPILVGQIERFDDPKSLWIVRDMFSNSWKIIITEQTRFPIKSQFSVGNLVTINGIKKNHTMEAFAIRELNNESRGFQKTWKIRIHMKPQENAQQDENQNIDVLKQN